MVYKLFIGVFITSAVIILGAENSNANYQDSVAVLGNAFNADATGFNNLFLPANEVPSLLTVTPETSEITDNPPIDNAGGQDSVEPITESDQPIIAESNPEPENTVEILPEVENTDTPTM